MYMYVCVFQMSVYKSVGFMMGFGYHCVDLKKKTDVEKEERFILIGMLLQNS